MCDRIYSTAFIPAKAVESYMINNLWGIIGNLIFLICFGMAISNVIHTLRWLKVEINTTIVGSLRDREVPCSASNRQGPNFESCVWRTVSSQSSHHPQEVLLAQFSLYVHKGGLKPDSFIYLDGETSFTDKVNSNFNNKTFLIAVKIAVLP